MQQGISFTPPHEVNGELDGCRERPRPRGCTTFERCLLAGEMILMRKVFGAANTGGRPGARLGRGSEWQAKFEAFKKSEAVDGRAR